jgi:hypothetical protein
MTVEVKSEIVSSEDTSGGVEWHSEWQADCLVLLCESSGGTQSEETPVSLRRGALPEAAKLRRSLFRA